MLRWSCLQKGLVSMKYNIYMYAANPNAVIMTDMDGKDLVIECEKAEARVILENPEDEGYLARLAMYEPASYVEFAMKLDGLQGYVEAINVFN